MTSSFHDEKAALPRDVLRLVGAFLDDVSSLLCCCRIPVRIDDALSTEAQSTIVEDILGGIAALRVPSAWSSWMLVFEPALQKLLAPRVVSVNGCCHMNDDSLHLLFYHFSAVRKLSIERCGSLRGERPWRLPATLQHLRLAEQASLVDAADLVRSVLRSCAGLRRLDLDGVNGIDDAVLEQIALHALGGCGEDARGAVASHSQLSQVCLRRLPSITTPGCNLLCSVPRITAVAVRDCPNVSMALLKHVTGSTFSSLTSLSMSLSKAPDSGVWLDAVPRQGTGPPLISLDLLQPETARQEEQHKRGEQEEGVRSGGGNGDNSSSGSGGGSSSGSGTAPLLSVSLERVLHPVQQTLTALDLSDCGLITRKHALAIASAIRSGALARLDLSRCFFFPPTFSLLCGAEAVTSVAAAAAGLACSARTGEDRMPGSSQPVAEGCLSMLVMTGCRGVSDDVLEVVSLAMPRLESLILSRCRGISSSGLMSLVVLPRLRRLDISDCPNVAGPVVKETFRSLKPAISLCY